ncbi:MAG: PQQ-binding-like beta-propeller repeat protein [Planctomycetota bacterium]
MTVAVLSLCLAPVVGAAPSVAQEPETKGKQQFALPLARDAQTLAERVVKHIEGDRREEALSELQTLFERHATDLLPADWRDASERKSQFPVYPGAALWAWQTLRAMPADWRARYVERHEPTARLAYEAARERLDREALSSVLRRWPLCPAAEEAAWTLGDLELEAGHGETALAAWSRAEELALGAGRMPRFDAAARRSVAAPASVGGGANLTDAGAGGPLPRARSTSWSTPAVDLGRIGRLSARRFNSFPVVSAGTLVATNSIDVVAIDTATGKRRWHFEGPPAWEHLSARDNLFEGISHDSILIAPAIGGGVVVAALQLPISIDQDDEWQGIEIKTPIPERRLFAFDLATGERLWDHSPEIVPSERGAHSPRLVWNPWAGSYAERMIVSAPPIVAGTRVLVPCYLKQGRIDFHLACYDLETGGRLWSTALISGQRPRNMFGQVSEEFVSTPVTVVGDRVIVQTELGTVASVDLASGQIQWQCRYDQIEIPKTRNYGKAQRLSLWREAPPIVANGIVVSTPSDSNDLLGIDLEDGRVLWAYNAALLGAKAREAARIDLLLGADDEHIYLSGPEVVTALRKRGGLRTLNAFQHAWSVPIDGKRAFPRPLLTAEAVLVAGRTRIAIDRRTGRELDQYEAAWPDDSLGNLWVGEGVLYSLSHNGAHAFFDWDLLLERKRAERRLAPGEPGPILAEARLHLDRAQALFESKRELDRALGHLDEAEVLFAELDDERAALAERYRLERTRADLHGELGAHAAVARALELALELAPSRLDRADVLLRIERNAEALDDPARRLRALTELAALSEGLFVPRWRMDASRDWLFGEALVDESRWESVFRMQMPLPTFATLAAADLAARQGRTQDALEDLHAVLFAFGDLAVGEDATGAPLRLSRLIEARIERRLEMDGREAYESFETRADAILGEAGQRAPSLENLIRRYPHSRAAETAQRRLEDIAFERPDPSAAIEQVYRAASIADVESEAGARLLSRLADALGRHGNDEFHAGLRASLAHDFPELRRAEEDSSTFTDLAVEAALPAESPPPASTFDERAAPIFSEAGTPWQIGRLTSRSGAEPVLRVLLRPGELLAFAEASPALPTWRVGVSSRLRPQNVALAEGRLIVAAATDLEAFGVDGRPAWRAELGVRSIYSVVADQGVVVVHARTPQHHNVLYAFEAHDGRALWTLPLRGRHAWQPGIFGTGVLVIFSQPISAPHRYAVVDLYRGVERARHVLPDDAPSYLGLVAWCRGRHLFLPDDSASRGAESGVAVIELDSGEEQWNVRFGRTQELVGTLHVNDEDYLIASLADAGSRAGSGGVYRLDRRTQRATRVIELEPGSYVLGVDDDRRSIIEQPFAFVRRSGRGDETPIEAWNLETGRRLWSRNVPVSAYDLFGKRLPQPAVSRTTVALCYESNSSSIARTSITLEFLDRGTGLLRDRRELRRELRTAGAIELMPLGATLFLLGYHDTADSGWLEILETPR